MIKMRCRSFHDGPSRIMALAWSPNNLKLAVCNADRIIILFDETGEKKDKFPTKPSDPKNGRKSYVVKGLSFSPDSTKLAVAQSDNIIFIYKLGEDWGDKKVICNKFIQQCPVTCLIWLTEGPVVYGQADGKVRAAHVKANKSQTLYATNSHVIALAPNVRGTGFLSGHADGTIVRYYVAEDSNASEQQGRVVTHPVPPYALGWAAGHIVAAGCDRRVTVYDTGGRVIKQFDYPNEQEFTVACCSPSGQAVAIGSYDRVRVFAWSPRQSAWTEQPAKEIPDLYTVSALAWKRDGSRVVCGALCGSVELFESVLKRTVWKDKFEMTYVGPSQVLVKPLQGQTRGVILKSQFGHEIDDVRIMGQDRYLVARTPDTLLLGDLHRNLLSEVPWPDTGRLERFYFDNPNVCLIFNAGELSLVEYGSNSHIVLGDLHRNLLSEVPWPDTGRLERFYFDNPNVCLIFNAGELSLVEYGSNSHIVVGDLHRNLLSEVPWPDTGRLERFYFDNPNVCLIFNAGELSLVEYGSNSHIVVGDLHRNLLSEVPWPDTGRLERFYFDNPNVCLIFNAGELSLVEYGSNSHIVVGDLHRNLLSEVPWPDTGRLERFYFDNPNVCLIFNAGELSLVEYGSNSHIVVGDLHRNLLSEVPWPDTGRLERFYFDNPNVCLIFNAGELSLVEYGSNSHIVVGDLHRNLLSEVPWPDTGRLERFYFDNPNVCLIFNAGELSLVEYGSNSHIVVGDLHRNLLSEVPWPDTGRLERFYFDNPNVCLIFNAGELSLVEYGSNSHIVVGDLHRNLLSEVPWPDTGRLERFYFDNPNVCLIFNAGELSLVEYGSNSHIVVGDLHRNLLSEVPWPDTGRLERFYFDNPNVCLIFNAGELSLVEYGSNSHIVVGDLHRNLLSEVPWPDTGRLERFYFDNPNVCLIFNAGELSLVEYGTNEILGSVSAQFCKCFQLTTRGMLVVDLVYGMTLLQLAHDSKIDWLELNETGHKLLYRDKKMRLTLLDTRTGQRHAILSYCTFVQWVPGSDVVVAQSRNNACVWYNIDTPDRVSMFPVRGEIVDVVRADGKTEIFSQDGNHQLGYELDEGLVEFGTAVHDSDFGRAVLFLESLGQNVDAEGMWQNLADIALQLGNLRVAERCYAALGDMSRTHYLRETLKIATDFAAQHGGDGMDCPEVWARMAILNKQLKTAETIYLEQNQLDKALDMYIRLHKWDQAISLAETKGYSGLPELQARHLQWLLDTRQEERAAELKEKTGEYTAALSLYLKANMPAKAARLVTSVPELVGNEEVVARVVAALLKGEHFTQAGQLYEAISQVDKAMECYRKGNAYAKAVELARYVSPKEVVVLEEQWGDYLTTNKQLDAAISHYIEAGKTVKALDAALGSRQWKKAVQIIQVIEDTSLVAKHYAQLGRHFASVKDYKLAEHLFSQAGLYREAIEMYIHAGDWDKAHTLATRHLEPDQVTRMFLKQGQALETVGKLKEAEKLYVAVDQPDMAIAMYKSQRQYDQMMRLVQQHRADLVLTTHHHLAQQLESEGNLRGAEQHYLAADQWKLAVKMYRGLDMWDDAYRVAKTGGGEQAGQQVAFLWAKSLGGDSAVKLLSKFGLLETCIDYACDSYQFEFAFELAKSGIKWKMSDIHYKYAMALEDDGKFKEAEEQFIKAGKPKEAVMMYMHSQDWESAERVAQEHDEESLGQVLHAQAKQAFLASNYQLFESLLLRAHKPELIVKQYQEAGLWVDALRVCREYLPAKLASLQAEYEREVGSRGARDVTSILSQAHQWQQSGEYKTAVDCYLRVNNNNCRDPSTVLKALTEAASITNKYLEGDEGYAAARALCPRLIELKQHSLAAQTYLAVDLVKEAVDTFMLAEEWAKAKKVAQEFQPGLEAYVEEKYKESLRRQGRADQLADVDIISALDLLCERGQWSKCLETARPHGPQVLHKYVALYATHLIKDGDTLKALSLYTQMGAPAFPQNYNIYRRISVDVIATTGASGTEVYATWAKLRNMLYKLSEGMSGSSDGGSATHYEFRVLMQVAHYCALRAVLSGIKDMEQLVANISIAMLRHSDVIPADKAFYEAGVHAREVGRDSEAFVFLNHYLDIVEAIEEGSLDSLDYSDFVATDFPQEIPLPAGPYLPQAEHEAVKEWVLAVSMDQSVQQVLPLDSRGLYPSTLVGQDSASTPVPPCVVTGYPVFGVPSQTVTFKRAGCVANREDWNRLTMAARLSPTNTDLQDTLKFISEWCGALPNFSF